MATFPLPDAPLDRPCVVAGVTGDDAFVARLRELGLEAGTPIRLMRRGPSLVVRVGESSHLALRAHETRGVLVAAVA